MGIMTTVQPGIMEAAPVLGRALRFQLELGSSLAAILDALAAPLADEIVGMGSPLVSALGKEVPGLRQMPALQGKGVHSPSTPAALWVFLRGSDRGELLLRGKAWQQRFSGLLQVDQVTDLFRYKEGRDLSGYVDGTENPEGDEAVAAAVLSGAGAGLDGSSFVAVQNWVHDLARFAGHSQSERDQIVGRRQSDNEELQDAPPSAHVKRSAQEDFTPEAFMLRRSMPFADDHKEGLMFVAFGKSFDAFEAVMRRMLGLDDGIVDALYRFTRPVDGAYYWCPPVVNGALDLRALR
jgi:putative iron-dependent peroxidase